MARKSIFEIDKNMLENISTVEDGIKWYDLNNSCIMGRAFESKIYNRLDDSFVSENVETLKLNPAGFNICFKTNAKTIKLKAKLAGAAYMSHMTAVGTIGFSLYVKEKGKWVFLNCTKINKAEYTVDLLNDCFDKEFEYRLYFPLYQILESAFVGVNEDAKFKFYKLNQETLVIYGTSISQGGCATRPGMDYGAILGRMLNLNVINLGFSGSCKMEHRMLEILNMIEDKKYLIFEVECNTAGAALFNEKFPYFMENLKNKDDIKIYLVSHFDEAMGLVKTGYANYRKEFYDAQKAMCEKYNITFVDGTELIKEINKDGSVDGAHLSDLGFYFVAKGFAKIIRKDK